MAGQATRMIAKRIQKVQDPVIPIVGRWTRENPGTISLGQGVVHYAPPPEVFEAVSRAAVEDRSLDCYGSVVGNEQLLDLIKQKTDPRERHRCGRRPVFGGVHRGREHGIHQRSPCNCRCRR